MAEIRDFLADMTVPILSSQNFATDFEEFCKAVRDNINKIVSAPFLKGDRGSRVRIKNEYLKLQVDANGIPVPPGETGDHEEWSDFAKSLIRAIYGAHPGTINPDLPLPLVDIDSNHPNGLITPDDPDWENMVMIDGGYVTPAEFGYEFESFGDSAGTMPYGNGKVRIISVTDTSTTVRVVENSEPGWVGREFVISATENNFDPSVYYQIIENDVVLNVWVKIGDKIYLPEDGEDDPELFFSYDVFNDLEYIPVCYDEDSGKKFLCVPFYFFDGRLNYVGYMDWTLSLFRDMSVTVFGEADFMGNPTREDIENPNCWNWIMNTTNALPKLYYNTELDQFCWEIAGEQTNIIAQGLKGDKGDSANVWLCGGEVTGGVAEEIITINRILAPYDGMPISNIQAGDLVIAVYDDSTGHEELGENPPYRRVQFGIAHVSGPQCYIDYKYDCEIIHKLRNYSLHDYLRSIGVEPNGDNTNGGLITALYSLERGIRANAMAMWASQWNPNLGDNGGWNDNQHFIAPISLAKTSGDLMNTDKNTLPNKILNILYDTVVFKKTIQADNIVTNNGINTNAVGTLQTPITGNYLKEYRLGVLCNILSARKSDNPVTGRMGESNIISVDEFDMPSGTSSAAKSTGEFLYIESELVVGWIPSLIADIFHENLSDNRNNPTLDIYRAQKYHLYVRVPVLGSISKARISLDGRSWSQTIYLNTTSGTSTNAASSLSHKGSGRNMTISIDENMKFEEFTKWQNKSTVDSGFVNNVYSQMRLTGYKYTHNNQTSLEFFYEFATPRGFLRKDKIKYTADSGENRYYFYLNQFRLLDGSLKMSASGGFNIDNLFWFGSRNITTAFADRQDITPESLKWPLTDDGYSFLNYFKSGQNNYIRTTNDEGNYMWQGRILSANPKGNTTSGRKQDLYYINTSFYETLYPSNFFTFIVKNPDNDTYNDSIRHISRVPINSAIHIYPEGICGLAYDRVITNSNNPAWNPDIVDPAAATIGTYVPAEQQILQL